MIDDEETIMNDDTGGQAATPTAAELYVDPYPGRRGNERITLPCSCGDGMYKGITRITDAAGNPYCFDCGGTAKYSFLVSSARAKARRQAKRLAEKLAMPARRAEWEAAHPEAAAAIRTYRHRNDFIQDMQERLDQFGSLTDKQEAAVLRVAGRLAAEDAEPKVVVPQGRHTVEGVIVSVTLREDLYGRSTWKMLVKADAGFKVWGTIPGALIDVVMNLPEQPAVTDALKGARVRFMATLKPKDDEAGFGLFARPTKADLLEVAA